MGTRIGYVAGSIDPFSRKHLSLLHHARTHCDVLVAGVLDDARLRATTGINPPLTASTRAQMVRDIDWVDEVFVETTSDPVAAWNQIRFTHLFVGRDVQDASSSALMEQAVSAVGVKVVYVSTRAHRYSDALWRAFDAVTRTAPAVVG